MPPRHALTAILPCNDLDASEAFYGRLGFTRPDADRPPPGEDDGYRMLADGQGGALHLTTAVEDWLAPGRNPFGLYLYTEDVDGLAARFPGEVIEKGGPADKPWGMYEFALSDPDQTLVRVGWPSRLRGCPSGLRPNRSMPASVVIPELAYDDVDAAVGWLAATFGFTPRLRIGGHRAQINVGDGAVVLTQRRDGAAAVFAVMVRVEDVDAHHSQAAQAGAEIVQPPTDQPYGERQCSVRDLGGHIWTFSQSVADVAPEAWGGVVG